MHYPFIICLNTSQVSSRFIKGFEFFVQLNFGIDESYKLFIPSTGYPLFGRIEVGTEQLKIIMYD